MQRPTRKKGALPSTEALPDSQKTAQKPFPWKWYTLAAGIIAFLLYVNTLGHEFTVDDTLVTSKNKFTTQGLAGLDEIFSNPYRAGFWDRKEGLYRPLSVAMFAVEWEIGSESPFLGHLMNVLLYALTAMLVVSVTRKLLPGYSPWIILAASFLYIVHPVHTEVVANVKSRDEILAFVLGMLSLWSLLKSRENENAASKLQLLSVSAFLLALFSKENALTWLGVFPLALWFTGNMKPADIAKKMIPYALAAGIFMICRFIVLNTVGSDYELMLINNSMVGASGPAERFATAVSILGRYILLLIAPVTLVFDYSYNTIPNVGLADFRFLLAFLVFGYALYYALKNTPLKKPMAFGILFFLGTVVLVSNLFLLIEATMAERFLYTPSYGFCLVAALLLGSLIKPAGKGKNSDTIPKGFIVPVGIVLALFSVRTIARNFDWKDNYTLLTKDVQSNPESARIRYAYGSALLFERAVKPEYAAQKTEYLNKAIEQLSKGVALIENYNDAWFHLGLAYKELENGPEAVKAFEKARSLKAFDEATKFSNSGIAYGMSGQYDKAVADLRVAITLEPDSSDHYNNLGLYLGDANRLNEAMGALDTAIILNSNNDKAYYNKGNVYAKAGDFRQAMINYAKTIELKPGSSDALNNTGNCYAAMQKPDSALIWFQKAAEADPTNRKAFTNLGVTYMILGDSVKGKEYMNRANAMNSGL